MAEPVVRAAITSPWSQKIDRAWVASDRAATWTTPGVSSPAILNRFGSISSRPCEAVKVVASAPPDQRTVQGPGGPALALHLDHVRAPIPRRLARPAAAQASADSPMGDAGVIG